MITHAPLFPYFRENSTCWPTSLAALRQKGANTITIPVDWAVHESTKGIRDFSRSSRLRIERLLAAAEENGLKVIVSTGFGRFLESAPVWARSNWEIPALIPSARVFDRPSGTELTSLCSLYDFEFRSSWLGFLDELFSVLSLYAEPEGPLTGVEVDLAFFSLDQGALRAPSFVEALTRRYRTIEQLNLRYRTSFRSFESVCSSQGFRVLLDKRPWHAIYDYKWCRRKLLQEFTAEMLNLPSAESLRRCIRPQLSFSPPAPKASYFHLFVDGTLLDIWSFGEGIQAFPCAPEGFLHPQASMALKIWENLSSQAHQDGVDAQVMGDADVSTTKPATVSAFVCGRFLSQSWIHKIQDYASQGGEAILPFGLPQFDECLAPAGWRHEPMVSAQLGEIPVTRRKIGKGNLWIPATAPEFGEGLWEQMVTLAQAVHAFRSNSFIFN